MPPYQLPQGLAISMKIRYDHISKSYPEANLPAVKDISLEIQPGEFVVFLGPSGCGKTTLLKMTNRLIEPSGGTIYLDTTDIRKMEVNQLRRRIGYVIQQVGLFPHMTVAENVAVVPSLLGWSRAEMDARVDELLDLVHMPAKEFRGRYPAQLSGGQQQRVGLARALAADPDLMLMDEPFGAIDAITRASLQDEMLDLQRRLHKTILFVTHDVDEALRLADKIAVLNAGEVVQFGSPCELLSRPANDFVRELIGADDLVRQLGLIRVDSVMEPLPPGENSQRTEKNICIPSDASLRDALSRFLQPGINRLWVIEGDRPVGQITFEQLRGLGCADSGLAEGE